MRTVAAFTLVAALAVVAPLPNALAQDKKRDIAAIENDLVADAPAVRAKAAAELADRFPDGAAALPMLVDLLDDDKAVAEAAAKTIDSMAIAGAAPLAAYFLDEGRWKSDVALTERLPVLVTLKAPSALDGFDYEREEKKLPMTAGEPAISALLPDRHAWSAATKLLPEVRGGGSLRPLAAAAMAMHAADVLAERGIAPPAHAARSTAAGAVLPLAKHQLDLRAWVGARLLARLTSSDAPVISALTETLAGRKKAVALGGREAENASQRAACVALGRLGASAGAVAPTLLDLASRKETDYGTAVDCAEALIAMGREADVAALVSKKHAQTDVFVSALVSERLAADVVVPHLIAKLEASEYGEGIMELRDMGPAAKAALPALKKHPYEDVRGMLRLLDAILAIDPADADAMRVLDKALEDPELGEEELFDARGIVNARVAGSAALAARIEAMCATKGKDAPTPGDFCTALGRCGADAKFAVQALVTELAAANVRCADPHLGFKAFGFRRALADTLGRIGPHAFAAVAPLTALRDKGDSTIRVPAARAIRLIMGKK